jgi:hypothetical protein
MSEKLDTDDPARTFQDKSLVGPRGPEKHEEDTNSRGAPPGPVPGSRPGRSTGEALFGDHPS